MTEDETDSIIIRQDVQFDYCPYCGRETEREEKPVGRTPGGEVSKTNIEVRCPFHGVIIVAP